MAQFENKIYLVYCFENAKGGEETDKELLLNQDLEGAKKDLIKEAQGLWDLVLEKAKEDFGKGGKKRKMFSRPRIEKGHVDEQGNFVAVYSEPLPEKQQIRILFIDKKVVPLMPVIDRYKEEYDLLIFLVLDEEDKNKKEFVFVDRDIKDALTELFNMSLPQERILFWDEEFSVEFEEIVPNLKRRFKIEEFCLTEQGPEEKQKKEIYLSVEDFSENFIAQIVGVQS